MLIEINNKPESKKKTALLAGQMSAELMYKRYPD